MSDDHSIEELTLESPAGIYAMKMDSGAVYVVTVPRDLTEPGEVVMRREDGVTSKPLRVFHARFPLRDTGRFYTDEGDGVKSVHTPAILAIRQLKST